MSASPDIFLSYNREDAEVAKLFADAFAGEGMEVWWDVTLRSGETYDEVTESALRGAKAVVVLWSPRSVASHWVRAEATIAHRAKTLVPATIEACDKPVMFELTQTAELSHWRGEAGDPAWRAFLGDVRRMLGQEASEPLAQPTPALGPAGSGVPIVAVLPINFRGGEEMEFLAEDLTEEITRKLARGYYDVTASGIMAGWRGRQVDYQEIGRTTGAMWLIEGKLQGSGSTVRLTMQLIDMETGNQPWSMRFLRKAEDMEGSLEEFAASVASEVMAQTTLITTQRVLSKPGPYSGWEHCLRSLAFQARMAGSESLRRALEEARNAVAAMPDLGLAHAQVANVLALQLTMRGAEIDDAMRREIRTHADRARQLDGDNPIVMGYLVSAYAVLGDGESALRLGRRLVEIAPNTTTSYLYFGFANMAVGRIRDAIAAYERQDRLSTHDAGRYGTLSNLGRCYLLEGRVDEAEETLDRSLALNPDYPSALKWKAIAAARRGDEEAALATIRRLREVDPEMTLDHHVRQMLFYRDTAGQLADPVATLRRLWAETEPKG